MSEVLPGICRTCGRDLVQVVGVRTYHPAVVLGPTDRCPVQIARYGYLTADVPDDQFTPEPETTTTKETSR